MNSLRYRINILLLLLFILINVVLILLGIRCYTDKYGQCLGHYIYILTHTLSNTHTPIYIQPYYIDIDTYIVITHRLTFLY